MRRREFIGGTALAMGAREAQGRGLPQPGAPQKSCILLLMVGGVSQLDTFDPKPEAPSHIRSPFKAMKTSVPGMQISELFPQLAREAHRFSLIRSMHYPAPLLHDEGLRLAQPELARSVVLPRQLGLTGGNLAQGQDEAHFLHPAALTAAEPERWRARYGSSLFGQSCLAARCLVETETRFVTVNMFDTVFGAPSWDMHGYSPFSSFSTYRDVVGPIFDMAVSALLSDLDERGLLDTTMVVGATEFGRSPYLNPTGGRDHWSNCWSSLVAGGGWAGGEIYGSSDAHGAEPRDNPVTPLQLVSRMQAVA